MLRDYIFYLVYFLVSKWDTFSTIFDDFGGSLIDTDALMDTMSADKDFKSRSGDKPRMINGYWENWANPLIPIKGSVPTSPEYYMNDFKANTHIFFSFLTLAKNMTDPNQTPYWDGKAIYDSYYEVDILEIMKPSTKYNPYHEGRDRILAM